MAGRFRFVFPERGAATLPIGNRPSLPPVRSPRRTGICGDAHANRRRDAARDPMFAMGGSSISFRSGGPVVRIIADSGPVASRKTASPPRRRGESLQPTRPGELIPIARSFGKMLVITVRRNPQCGPCRPDETTSLNSPAPTNRNGSGGFCESSPPGLPRGLIGLCATGTTGIGQEIESCNSR